MPDLKLKRKLSYPFLSDKVTPSLQYKPPVISKGERINWQNWLTPEQQKLFPYRGESITPIPKEVPLEGGKLPEPRKGTGFALDILTGRKTTENPLGLNPIAYARQFPLVEAAIVGIPAAVTLGAMGYEGLKATTDLLLKSSIMRNLSLQSQARNYPLSKEEAQKFADDLTSMLSRRFSMTQNWKNSFDFIRGKYVPKPETVQETENIVQLALTKYNPFIPKGTQTGAMAFGGLPKPIPPEIPKVPAKVTPAPEVTKISPTYENLTTGQTLVDQAGDRYTITKIEKEGVPGKWAYTVKGITIPDFVQRRPLGEIERYYKIEQPAIPKAEIGMPEAGYQPAMIEGVTEKEVRPAGKGVVTQISMEEQLKLEQARKAVETTKYAPQEIDNMRSELEGLKYTLENDPIALARFTIGGKKVDLTHFISFRERSYPDYFTIKEAQSLFPGHDFTALTKKGRVPKADALDDLSKKFNMSPDEITDRVMRIAQEKARIKGLETELKGITPEMITPEVPIAPTIKPTPQPVVSKGVTPPPVVPPEQPVVNEVKRIQELGRVAPDSVSPEQAKVSHIELSAPDGPSGPKPPPTKVSGKDKPEDVMRYILDRTAPDERPDQVLLRLHEAAINNAQRRVNLIVQKGGNTLKKSGIGVSRRGQLVPKETDIPKLDELYNALHNPSKIASGEIIVPKELELAYKELRDLTNWEEAARLDFDPEMATVVDYFYRGWKPPKGAFADVRQGRPLVKTPSFKKVRVNATYQEMRDAGFEPLYWNPYQQWATSRIQGVRYREQMELVSRLKGMGDEFARPHVGGPIPKGWRVPEVGPAFEGKPFAYVSIEGEPLVAYTRRWIVPDNIANSLENIYGKRPDFGKFTIAGKVIDPLQIIDFLTFLPKRAKLFGSFFQQVDFLTRAGAGSWTGAVENIRRGHPISAFKSVVRYPQTAIDIIRANVSPTTRRSLAEMLDDTTLLISGREGVTLKGISEAGLSTMDVTIFPEDMEKLIRQVASETGILKRIPSAIGDLESAMRRGLFQGVYPAAMITDIKNNIVHIVARQFPNKTDKQINAIIAKLVNIKYSTISPSQSAIQNRFLRETLRRLFFSVGESEGLLRQASGGIHGPYASFWRKHWLGVYLFVIATASIIHLASTGKPLPKDRYTPISMNSYGPLPFGYNTKFASPTLPFKGRGGTEVTLDVVGQMDTAFRILDPVSFLASRESVPIRTMVNQVSGVDFYGAPIDDVGPGGIVSRTIQLLTDLFAPIGIGQSGLEMTKGAIPGLEEYLPRGESRLGTVGLAIQMAGVNLRTEGTLQLLDRYAKESGFKKPDGTPVISWNDLQNYQKNIVEKNEMLNKELTKRGKESVLSGSLPAIRRVLFDEIDTAYYKAEEVLGEEFTAGIRSPEDFRDRYHDIQLERSNQKIGSLATLTMMGYGEKIPTDRIKKLQYLADHLSRTDMNERALGEYFMIFEIAKTDSGFLDWNVFDGLETFYKGRWTEQQKKFVEDNTGYRNHPPLIQEYIDAKEKLKPYWELPEKPSSIRRSYRVQHPEANAILVKWYGYKSVSGGFAPFPSFNK